jgi:hypothetical protein
MTPEERERFERWDRMMDAILHRQVQRNVDFDNLRAETEKNAAAIRDLIVICRSLVDDQQELREFQRKCYKEMHELHEDSDRRLNALIAHIDRILGHRPNGQN